MSWVAPIQLQKYKKSVIPHPFITDFILIHNSIHRFFLFVGIPNASINSSFLRLNQLT